METACLATSVLQEETSQQIFSRSLETGKTGYFWGNSYRHAKIEKYPDLMPVTEQTWDEHDRLYGTHYYDRSRECRTRAWYVRDDLTGKVHVHSNACRLRWCPLCADSRKNVIGRNCYDFLLEQGRIRFFTLTVKHRDDPLRDQVARLKKCFVKLRQGKVWKENVTGCIWFLQVKRYSRKGEWHPHLHVLLTGQYVPQKWLSARWRKLTGDSFIVDIREVTDLEKALYDACRYAALPANLLEVEESERVGLMHALDGVRLCGTAGICKAVSLRPQEFKLNESGYTMLGSYADIMRLAAQGDALAVKIVQAEWSGEPLPADELVGGSMLFSDAYDEDSRGPPPLDEFSYCRDEYLWQDWHDQRVGIPD